MKNEERIQLLDPPYEVVVKSAWIDLSQAWRASIDIGVFLAGPRRLQREHAENDAELIQALLDQLETAHATEIARLEARVVELETVIAQEADYMTTAHIDNLRALGISRRLRATLAPTGETEE